jgi:hypothetical protein
VREGKARRAQQGKAGRGKAGQGRVKDFTVVAGNGLARIKERRHSRIYQQSVALGT